eukprot:gene11296-21486_t
MITKRAIRIKSDNKKLIRVARFSHTFTDLVDKEISSQMEPIIEFGKNLFHSNRSVVGIGDIAFFVGTFIVYGFCMFGELFYMFTPNKQQMSAESKPYFHCSSPIMDVPCMRCEGIKKKMDWWRQERPNMASGNIQCQLVAQNQSQSGNAASSIEVDVAKCKHLLKNSCYNARAGLAKKLDADGSASKLVRRCLTRDNARELLGHGYNDSALGFLTYISATKENVTVGYLQYLADSSFVQLHKKIAEATKSGISLNDSLYDIPYPWLEEFAATLSISKDGVNELLQPSWKILAGKAGIDITTILNLDKSATEMKTITIQLISFLERDQPYTTVAWLAQYLNEIRRNDVLLEEAMFGNCRKQECIRCGSNSEELDLR